MEKEQAECYVEYGIEYMGLSKKKCYSFLTIVLFILAISLALHRKPVFMMIVFIIALLSISSSIIFSVKYSTFYGFISVGSQLLFFCFALDLVMFGIYRLAEGIDLLEYIASIVIQFLSLGASCFLTKKHAERFKIRKGYTKAEIAVGAVAGSSCVLTLIIFRVFAPSLTFVVYIMVVLINFIVCLISIGIVMAFYRAYLIRRFNLDL